MSHIKKIFFTLAVCLAASVFIAQDVFAAVRIVTNAKCRLTVEYKHEEKSLENARFHLYKVGEISEDAELTADILFDQYNIEFNTSDLSILEDTAKKLEDIVKAIDVQPQAVGETDNLGHIVWENMPVGVYLLSGNPLATEGKIYSSSPQIIFLPSRNTSDEAWNYDLSVTVKNTVRDETEKTTSVSVIKKWNDAGYEDKRPASVTVNLLCDNQRYDSIVLSADNGWTHTWTGLSGKRNWSVEEIVPENYIARTEFDGSRFILTNSRENIPDTGVLWWPVPVMILIGSICIGYGIYIRKRI